MMNTDKLTMLDDIIKYAQHAKLELHKDTKIYTKNIVLGYSTAKALFESLKEQSY
jgi:hypothetical protein